MRACQDRDPDSSGEHRTRQTEAQVVVAVVRLVVVALRRAEVLWIVVRRSERARLRHDEPPRRTRETGSIRARGTATATSPGTNGKNCYPLAMSA